MRRLALSLLSILGAVLLPAQSIRSVPDSLTLQVGDTVRLAPVVRNGAGAPIAGAALTFSGTNATAFSVARDGVLTARAPGCGVVRTSYAPQTTHVRAQVPVCVVARATPAPSTPPSPTNPLLFASDWSTAAGSSDHALTDGGKWTAVYCTTRGDVVRVVSGAPVDWTQSPHVIQFRQLGPVCGGIEARGVVPASTSHWGRTYIRVDETTGTNHHALTYNLLGAVQVTLWGRQSTAAGVQPFVRTYYAADGSGASYPRNLWAPAVRLDHGRWYRFEWHMEYVTARTYRLWPRVYDLAGTLLLDATNYFENDAPPTSGRTLAAWYAAGHTFGLTDPELGRHLGLTMEGQPGAQNTGGAWYHAQVALSLSGWIGR